MCGRVIVDYEELMDVAGGTELAAWMQEKPDGAASSWNLKPTQQLPLIFTSPKDGEKRFETAHWSIVPTWSKSLKLKYPTFNARSESVSEKATYKGALKQHRCLIPVTGFYEWVGSKTARIPHAIFGPEKILPMAGLYSWWRDPDAAEGEGWQLTATILTQVSAGIMAPIHDRMPVFLDEEIIADWLDPDTVGDQTLVDAAAALSVSIADTLTEYAVAPLRGDGPDLLVPA